MDRVFNTRLQNETLRQFLNDGKMVDIFFVNGVQPRSIRGTVKGFNNFIVIIDSFGVQRLIYKQSISNICTVPKPKKKFGKKSSSKILTWHE